MPYPTPTNPNEWLYAVIKGTPTPGTIPRGGVRGFTRPTGWDIKRGKGSKGATLTLKDQPPAQGSITMQLIGPGGFYADGTPSRDFAAWDNFVVGVLSISTTQQQAEGLAIYYPQFASIDLTAIVVEDYTGPEYVGKGLYHAVIKLIEWSPPPPVSIVQTPSGTSPDNPAPDTVPVQDPRIAALQAQIAAAAAANKP